MEHVVKMETSTKVVLVVLIAALVFLGGCTSGNGGSAGGDTTLAHTLDSSGCDEESGVCSMPETTEEPPVTCDDEGGVCSMPE